MLDPHSRRSERCWRCECHPPASRSIHAVYRKELCKGRQRLQIDVSGVAIHESLTTSTETDAYGRGGTAFAATWRCAVSTVGKLPHDLQTCCSKCIFLEPCSRALNRSFAARSVWRRSCAALAELPDRTAHQPRLVSELSRRIALLSKVTYSTASCAALSPMFIRKAALSKMRKRWWLLKRFRKCFFIATTIRCAVSDPTVSQFACKHSLSCPTKNPPTMTRHDM